MKALIVVDMQYDFINPKGALAVPHATDIVVPIQDYAAQFDGLVALTRCWHPSDHCSFRPQGGPWPIHCVRETPGAQIQPGLFAMLQVEKYISPDHLWQLFDKGRNSNKEELSGFYNPLLSMWLLSHKVTHVEVCGLARDFCVQDTAVDAAKLGYETVILEQLTKAVDSTKEFNYQTYGVKVFA